MRSIFKIVLTIGYVVVTNGSNEMDFLIDEVKFFLDYSRKLQSIKQNNQEILK